MYVWYMIHMHACMYHSYAILTKFLFSLWYNHLFFCHGNRHAWEWTNFLTSHADGEHQREDTPQRKGNHPSPMKGESSLPNERGIIPPQRKGNHPSPRTEESSLSDEMESSCCKRDHHHLSMNRENFLMRGNHYCNVMQKAERDKNMQRIK